ncbi:putative transposable element encoded protein [Trachipleistophora hominis]|uniref:Putative transposable element encoded protein n=1 Tax=Trachipleistophora hominis TaxID=72359 RepID=L7JVF5_TRAHO|nr:putative transposable element encoded protein [Trachipleistophora hominis]
MEEFLGILLGRRCHESYDLCVKLVVEVTEYLARVVRELAVLYELVTDFLHEPNQMPAVVASFTDQKNVHVVTIRINKLIIVRKLISNKK